MGDILDLTTVLNKLDLKLRLIKVSESFLYRGVNGGGHKMGDIEVRNGGTEEFAHFDHLLLFDHHSSLGGHILDLMTVLNRPNLKCGLIQVSVSCRNRAVDGGCHKVDNQEVRNGYCGICMF